MSPQLIHIRGKDYYINQDDNGTTWQQINSAYTDIRFEKLVVNEEKILAVTGNVGLFYSSNNGSNWTERNSGISAVSINNILVFQNYIFLSSENSIYRSTDYGNTWSKTILPYQFHEFGINSNEEIYVAAWGALYKSTNFGSTWNQVFTGINDPWYTDIFIDMNDNIWISGYLCKIYCSINNGVWLSKSTGINDDQVTEIFLNNDGNWFAGTYSDSIYRSTNNGENWSLVFSGGSFIMSITSDLYGNLLAGMNGGIFKSSDDGLNWINKGFSNTFTWSIVVNSNNNYLVSSGEHVYKSVDKGDSWDDISENLPPNNFLCELALDDLNFIYAGTKGYGLYNTIETTIPVELTSFTTNTTGNSVTLNWQTSTEINNNGFEIERKSANSNWEKIGFVKGNGSTTEEKSYSYTDGNLIADRYSYRLKQNDFDGSFEYSNVVEVEIVNPKEYKLSQNYPNPFNPSTKINYSVPQSSFVTLKVYDILGNEIATLVNEENLVGNYEVEFSASNLSSGIYFYSITAGSFRQTKKMILAK